jgi:hypothetical protein
MPHDDNRRDLDRDLANVEPDRASFVPDDVPDPVETRDPSSEPVPRRSSRALLFALPVLALALIGLVWLVSSERRDDAELGVEPVGTAGESGFRSDTGEGLPRGDDAPLNPDQQGRLAVVSSMAHLLQKDDYVGRPVEIGAIPVGDVKGPRTFEVGRLTNRTLVVVEGDAAIVPSLGRGDLVRLSGRLESAEDTTPPAGLNADDREALDGADVFIRATLVERQDDAGANQVTIPESERAAPQPGGAEPQGRQPE